MADKLLIIMANADPNNGSELGVPIYQATVAAAMEYEVEIVLTGRCAVLAKPSLAEKLFVQEGGKSIYDFIKDAHEAGVIIKVSTPVLEQWGDDLIPEIFEIVGEAYVISEAMNDDTVTFTY
ncbi:MAG: peroxiredoxin [Gammaproteobacteria bacterium]|nr:peroxiredoxin [Gammaproteobacteria bacterium]MBU2478454.1 peroxiredoxin [Gammaproteobacteria bacterium]